MSDITTSSTTADTADADTSAPDRRKLGSWTEGPRRTVLGLTILFALIELSGVLINVPIQVALTAAAAFFSVNLGIFGYRTNKTAGVVMAAVFTTRLVTLTLPAQSLSLPTRTLIVAAAMMAVSYIATWVLSVDVSSGRKDEGYPLRPPLVSRGFTSAITVLAGFPIGWLAYLALKPDQLFVSPVLGLAAIAWALAALFLSIGALAEELLYRRLVAAMVQHTGRSQTPWISAALYGAVFIGSQNVFMVLLAAAAGALWAWSCERTGSIEPVVASHMIVVLLAFVFLPL
jgi:membrane protease YdiL (CAAX protease family)